MGKKSKGLKRARRESDEESEVGLKIRLKVTGDASAAVSDSDTDSVRADLVRAESLPTIKLKLSGQPAASPKKKGEGPKRARGPSPSPGPASPRIDGEAHAASARNLLLASLNSLQNTLTGKDQYQFFMDPVTEAIAPGYSAIIKQPMDFSTMDMKIKAGAYAGIDDYQRDFELMCNNALTYNEDTSVVYKAARKLLQQGLKVLQREKNSLQKAIDKLKKKRTVSKSPNAGAGGGDAAGHATVDYSGTRYETDSVADSRYGRSDGNTDTEGDRPRKKKAGRTISISRRESTVLDAENVLVQVTNRAALAAQAIGRTDRAQKLRFDDAGNLVFEGLAKNVNLGFLTSERAVAEAGEPTLGAQVDGRAVIVLDGREPEIGSVAGLLTGPYGSNLPRKDGANAGLTKEQEEVVQAVFGDKAGYAYARATLDFARGLGREAEDAANRMIEQLTDGRFQAEQWHDKEIRADVDALPDDTRAVSAADFKGLAALQELGIDVPNLGAVLRPGVAEARKKFETVQDVLDDTAGLLWELQRVQCKRRLTDTTGEPYTPDERAIANEIVFRLQMFLAKMPPAEAAGPAPAQASTTKAP